MPGSTAASSEEQTKAKVAESSATNGIFVRPVAVAGIFRPAEESANKPPALPEKRRFSALSGDLRPIGSGAPNNDFDRRRQSWDVKTKEVPFGQALLRKTPRNSIASPRNSKQDLTANGSSHENISCSSDSLQVSEANSVEKFSSKSEVTISNTLASNLCTSVKEVGNDLSKEKSQKVSNTTKESEIIDGKNTTNSSVNSLNKPTAQYKSNIKNLTSDKGIKSPNSVDSGSITKKVFGLIKRDSKPEITSAENSFTVNKSKAEVECVKNESIVKKKDARLEIPSKPDITAEKIVNNNLDPLKNKVRVYGVNKTAIKKDAGKNENEILVTKSDENKAVGKLSGSQVRDDPLGTNVVNKTSEIKISSKKIDVNIANKSADSKVENEASEKIITNKIVEKKDISSQSSYVASKQLNVSKSSDSKDVCETKVAEKNNEFRKSPSPPKDFRTVRRTSDVIAAKIQNIFSNISTPEKPPPLYIKKSKIQNKSEGNVDSTLASSGDKTTLKPEGVSNQSENKQTIESNKNVSKLPSGSKVQNSDPVNISKVAVQEVKIIAKRSVDDVNKEECKYKGATSNLADHSSLKKENKLASESNDILRSCKTGEVVTTNRVKAEVSLEKADSKTELSINAVSSKAEDKKNLNIGGKMPIKKQDQNSSDGTTSLKAPNQVDRKSSPLTVPLKTVTENSNKASVLKTETPSTCAGSGGKIYKIVTSSNSLTSSDNSNVELKSNNVSKKIETNISIKESLSTKSSNVSQSFVKVSADQKVVTSCVSEISQPNAINAQKTPQKAVNNEKESNKPNDSSKIEVAKITPSTVSSAVPTVNVLFRTKSPQSSITKEENRKKVVVETYSNNSPVTSAVINASKFPDKLSSSACDSVQEALRTVENVKNSLNSPQLQSKHSVVNLKKEELASVTLKTSISPATENIMPPNTAKITDKCSSIEVSNDKIESVPTAEKEKNPPSIVSETVKTESGVTVPSSKSDCLNGASSIAVQRLETSSKVEVLSATETVSESNIRSDNTHIEKKFSEMDKYSFSDSKVNVVDLNDWSKKFQLDEPEPPRVPLRRRTVRESMPPSLPIRSRFGSLKRIDDSPKYIARSPSQSSLPQRYSYTEMLSKVCSMGVLPYTESTLSKSCSSSSSQVSELWSELSEEQSNATHTAEMLESETTERMRLEKEVHDLQNRCSQVQLRSDKMEMEMMEARVYRTPELNGDLSEDEDAEANSSLYKQKYERAVRDMEIMKRRIQQQHEEEMEQKAMLKKASDKRLAEALEDVEEERQVANQWKRKAQKLGSELQDLRLMLEEQMARNGELEKKQRRFDAELSAAQEEIKKERLLREKLAREKDQAMHEKYSIEQDLQASKLDADTLHEKITQLNRELDELTLSSKGEEEVTQLKRAKQELERKSRDQEEELEELAAQVSMLEQAKLRLEMSLEKVRQEHRREASVREEEIEEIRASFSKKIKNLEAQLETEQDERHQLMKQKHELERRIYEMTDQPPPQDPEIERRLRRDLKRTKALLRDAQSMLEHTREGQSGKTLIRQLKNQLEDSEFAKAAAVKARQAVETELHDCQTQLEEATRVKNEVESRCLQLSREKSAIQTQLEEAEEEMAEVMKKYKAVVAQMSIDQKALSEQNQQIADLEVEKQMLKDQLSEVSHKFEHLAGQSEDTHKVHRLDGKIRDLESKLELEQTTRSRLEHQIARLKEQNERAREECDSLRNKELQAQEGVRRLQRQMRDLREGYSALQQKESEAYRKQHELEMALENTETDLQVTKNDLRLACQRIQDLQNALEDDLDSGTDVPDDSGSDSDDSFELSMLRNQSVTPTQRCDSAASNYSFASEGFRSRTSSFTHELSAFSRMMLSRRTSMDFLG